MPKRKSSNFQAEQPVSKRRQASAVATMTSFARVTKPVLVHAVVKGKSILRKGAVSDLRGVARTAAEPTIHSITVAVVPSTLLPAAAPPPAAGKKRKVSATVEDADDEADAPPVRRRAGSGAQPRGLNRRPSLATITEEEGATADASTAPAAAAAAAAVSKRPRLRQAPLPPTTPNNKKQSGSRGAGMTASVADISATQDAEALLRRLRLESSPLSSPPSSAPSSRASSIFSRGSSRSPTSSTPPSPPLPGDDDSSSSHFSPMVDLDFGRVDERFRGRNAVVTTELPSELADLVAVHSALLRTLNVLSAGRAGPVDVAKALVPAASMAWGKRKITLDEARICLGDGVVGDGVPPPLQFVDYGKGRVCVEPASPSGADADANATARFVDEPKLAAAFRAALARRWLQHQVSPTPSSSSPAAWEADHVHTFLASLPRAPVVKRSAALLLLAGGAAGVAVAASSSVLGKAQTALREIKNGQAARREKEVSGGKSHNAGNNNTTDSSNDNSNNAGPKLSLLDRLRAKEVLLAASAPSAAAAASLRARRAALQRCGDVAAVVSMLALSSGGGMRASWPLPAVLRRLRESLRTPLAADEAADVVRMLAAEVAPEWIRLVNVAGRDMVVLERAGEVAGAELARRVQALLAGCEAV